MSRRPRLSPPRLFVAAGLAGLAGLGAAAGPRLIDAPDEGPDAAYGPYALVCWQEGTRIFDERDVRDLATLDLRDTPGARLVHADGSRRVLLTFGESLCMVEYDSL